MSFLLSKSLHSTYLYKTSDEAKFHVLQKYLASTTLTFIPVRIIGLFGCSALEFFRTFSGELDLNLWTAQTGELIEEDRTLTFPIR